MPDVSCHTDRDPSGSRETRMNESSEPRWTVVREDDHGNIFIVAAGLTRPSGRPARRGLRASGHRQTAYVTGTSATTR